MYETQISDEFLYWISKENQEFINSLMEIFYSMQKKYRQVDDRQAYLHVKQFF